MAWTTPRTWVAGELVTAALMNTHLRDNLNAWAIAPHELWLQRNATQTISPSTRTAVSWDTEDKDVGFSFSPTSSTVTFQTSGVFSILFTVQWAGVTGTQQGHEIEISGGPTAQKVGHGGHAPSLNEGNQKTCAITMHIDSGSTLQCFVYHDNSPTVTIGAGSPAGTRLLISQVSHQLEV